MIFVCVHACVCRGHVGIQGMGDFSVFKYCIVQVTQFIMYFGGKGVIYNKYIGSSH